MEWQRKNIGNDGVEWSSKDTDVVIKSNDFQSFLIFGDHPMDCMTVDSLEKAKTLVEVEAMVKKRTEPR